LKNEIRSSIRTKEFSKKDEDRANHRKSKLNGGKNI
jgi:hypothetical protein